MAPDTAFEVRLESRSISGEKKQRGFRVLHEAIQERKHAPDYPYRLLSSWENIDVCKRIQVSLLLSEELSEKNRINIG